MGYDVIFLYRSESSARPFRSRLNLELTGEEFQQIKTESEIHSNRLREIPFTSLAQYLTLLEKCALEINSKNGTKIILLAAAVSDFDVCQSANQKIDSSSSFSEIKLKKVEKVISKLTSSWAPLVATFSFKLETNENLILKKSEKYFQQGVKGVIGNELLTRRKRIYFISKNQKIQVKKIL